MVGIETSSPAGTQRSESAERSPPQTPSSIRELHRTSPIKMSDKYASLDLLKEWPIVSATIEEAKEIYESVKGSNVIITGSLNLAEKCIKTFATSSFNLLNKVPFLVEQTDIIANDSLEFLQNHFPIVKESPEKVYEAFKKRINNVVEPVIKETKLITEMGRNTLNKPVKSVTTVCLKAMAEIGWANKIGINSQQESKTPKDFQSAPHTETSSQSIHTENGASCGPSRGEVRRVVTIGIAAVKEVAYFNIGLAVWAASQLPVIGRALNTSATPTQEQSGTAPVPKETTPEQQ